MAERPKNKQLELGFHSSGEKKPSKKSTSNNVINFSQFAVQENRKREIDRIRRLLNQEVKEM